MPRFSCPVSLTMEHMLFLLDFAMKFKVVGNRKIVGICEVKSAD